MKKNRVGVKSQQEPIVDHDWKLDKFNEEKGKEPEKVKPEEMRYTYLEILISELKPRDHFSIVEVGVWKAGRAKRMSFSACKIADTVSYTGYDLFEDVTQDILIKEFANKKTIVSLEEVTEKLNWFVDNIAGSYFTFNLIKGDTNITLKNKHIMADFVFIDGGHSVSTIENDYAAFKECPLVVLDDYYIGFEDAVTNKVGSNRVVDLIKKDPNYSVQLVHGPHDVLSIEGIEGTVGKIALAVVRKN